jgi:hypothetical protein
VNENSRFANTEGAHGEPYLVKHTVTTAEDAAGTLSIKTPFESITGYIYQVERSGEKQEQDAFTQSVSGGVITLADGTHNPTDGDVISLIAWGRGGR